MYFYIVFIYIYVYTHGIGPPKASGTWVTSHWRHSRCVPASQFHRHSTQFGIDAQLNVTGNCFHCHCYNFYDEVCNTWFNRNSCFC